MIATQSYTNDAPPPLDRTLLDLTNGPVHPSLSVARVPLLTGFSLDALPRRIIWGWKRDDECRTRMVYFEGRLDVAYDTIELLDPFLFYLHGGPEEEIAQLRAAAGGDLHTCPHARVETFFLHSRQWLRIALGAPAVGTLDRRLEPLAARSREFVPVTPPAAPELQSFEGVIDRPFHLLAGSGLSYESQLPMLKEIHQLFCVDQGDASFCLGIDDQLPSRLAKDLAGELRGFCAWHLKAACAVPSDAHRALRAFRDAGLLRRVFTDNVDCLFDRVGIRDYERVRGSGVINERYAADLMSQHEQVDTMLVVGVSADRRGIIAQAREAGLRLIVVNPYLPVSPGAKNLNYLHPDDLFFRKTAGQALPGFWDAYRGHNT